MSLVQILARLLVRMGADCPEDVDTPLSKAVAGEHARRHPDHYFACRCCGSAPWHNSWREPRPLCPNCTGAS